MSQQTGGQRCEQNLESVHLQPDTAWRAAARAGIPTSSLGKPNGQPCELDATVRHFRECQSDLHKARQIDLTVSRLYGRAAGALAALPNRCRRRDNGRADGQKKHARALFFRCTAAQGRAELMTPYLPPPSGAVLRDANRP